MMIHPVDIAEELNYYDVGSAYEKALAFKSNLDSDYLPEMDIDDWHDIADFMIEVLGQLRDETQEVPHHLRPGHYDRWDSALPVGHRLYR